MVAYIFIHSKVSGPCELTHKYKKNLFTSVFLQTDLRIMTGARSIEILQRNNKETPTDVLRKQEWKKCELYLEIFGLFSFSCTRGDSKLTGLSLIRPCYAYEKKDNRTAECHIFNTRHVKKSKGLYSKPQNYIQLHNIRI